MQLDQRCCVRDRMRGEHEDIEPVVIGDDVDAVEFRAGVQRGIQQRRIENIDRVRVGRQPGLDRGPVVRSLHEAAILDDGTQDAVSPFQVRDGFPELLPIDAPRRCCSGSPRSCRWRCRSAPSVKPGERGVWQPCDYSPGARTLSADQRAAFANANLRARTRMVAPASPKPAIIIAQVAGSGTGGVVPARRSRRRDTPPLLLL